MPVLIGLIVVAVLFNILFGENAKEYSNKALILIVFVPIGVFVIWLVVSIIKAKPAPPPLPPPLPPPPPPPPPPPTTIEEAARRARGH